MPIYKNILTIGISHDVNLFVNSLKYDHYVNLTNSFAIFCNHYLQSTMLDGDCSSIYKFSMTGLDWALQYTGIRLDYIRYCTIQGVLINMKLR